MPKISLGRFGVDSGQVMIVDPCYLSDWEDDEFDEKKIDKYQSRGKYPFSYNGACALTIGLGNFGGEIGKSLGVVSGTGYGDGNYEVFATIEDGRVKSLHIDFF